MSEKRKTGCDRMNREIASLKKEKADLQKSLNHKEAIFNGMPAGVLVIQKGRIIDANEIILRQLGYAAGEVMGRDLRDFVVARPDTAVGIIYGKRSLRNGERDPGEIEMVGKDGTALSWDVNVRKIRANGGTSFLIMFTQNEARKQREDRRVESLKDGALRTMASGLARALKNPIESIRDSLPSACQSSHPTQLEARARVDAALTTIESLSRTLESLITEVRDRSHRAPFDLRKVVKDALAAKSARIKEGMEKGRGEIKVKTYLRSVSPVDGDPEEIRQMLCCLVSNALEAMPGGGSLYLSTEETAGYAHIYIQDSGTGIFPQVRERICDPFFTTKGPEKSGLGLSVCRAIIRRHHGDMEIASKENEGTVITVRLPLAKIERRDGSRPPKRKSIRNARILIIDEDPMIGQLLLRTLESKACRANLVASAAEGLVQAGKKAFDLVIVGQVVSEVKGNALVRRLKESKKLLRVALIADYDNGEAPSEQRAPLADLVISRPIDMGQVLGRITEILSHRGKT